jgi:putative Mn2+ efflux pump MntP
MTKNPKAISFEQKITAIVFAMITEILFISVGVGAFYYKQYALGSVFIFISIIFILILLSKYISRAFKRYTLKTSDDELYKIKSLIESFKQSRNWPT